MMLSGLRNQVNKQLVSIFTLIANERHSMKKLASEDTFRGLKLKIYLRKVCINVSDSTL